MSLKQDDMSSKGFRPNKLDLCRKCGQMFLKSGKSNACPRCLEEEYLSRLGNRPIKPYSFKIEKTESSNTIATTEKDKKWSRKFDHCVKCGRNDVRHRARGLCFSCYERESEKKYRGKQSEKNGLAIKKLNREYLIEEYVHKKRSLGDIAKESSYTRQYIFGLMKKYRIERRPPSKARIEAMKKGKFEKFGYYEINEKFFGEWSLEMAWVLGLLFTDGFLRPFSISIWSMDIELLEKIKKILNSSNPIGTTTQSYDKSRHIYTFAFYREKMMEDLNRLGLHQRKSLNMMFPKVPEEYVRHFIRGCWDGDGSIYFESGKLRGSYTCGSFRFIEKLVQELYRAEIYKRTPPADKSERDRMWSNYPDGRFPLKIHEEKRSKSYYIKIDSKDSLQKLFHYLYDSADESTYLSRKYNAFVKGLKLQRSKAGQLMLDLDC